MSHTSLAFAGVHAAFVVLFLFAAAFFVITVRRRPADDEYLFFAVLCGVMSIYAFVIAWIYWHIGMGGWTGMRSLFDLTAASAMVSVPTLLQFVVRYTGSLRERQIMTASWGVTVGFLLMVLAGGYWVAPPSLRDFSAFGLSMPVLAGRVSAGGYLFFLTVGLSFALVFRMLWRAYRIGRRECLTAMAGVALCGLGGFNDACSAAGIFDAPPMLAISFLGLVYLMSQTLVERYGVLLEALGQRRAELERRSAELGRSLRELEQTQADLVHSEQLAVLGEFAAVITHEVRNPMQIVNNAVSTLRKIPQVTDHTRSLLGIIEDEMARLERLVGHLLNYARPIVPQRRPVRLNAFLSEILAETLTDEMEHEVKCDGAWPVVEIDPVMMRQAVEAVVVNAVQATEGRGRLAVWVARRVVADEACVVIGFEDDGEGMTETQREQATSPFYTTRTSGTGLGLPICERIVEAHGGALHIASEQGAGTAVSIVIPVDEDVALPSLDDLG